MGMKETIEFERPEGLPKGAVPAVVFVAPTTDDLRGCLYETLHPNGMLRSTVGAKALADRGYPVPTRTYTLTVELTEEQLKALDQRLPEWSPAVPISAAAHKRLVEIEAAR